MASTIYDQVTDKIISDLERGVRPWLRPWSTKHGKAGNVMRPLRHNGLPYSGMNVLLLWWASEEKGYSEPRWMTYKQASELGAHVRRGEKGTSVVYASTFEKDNKDTGDKDKIFFLKTYVVFNVQQIENLPARYFEAINDEPDGTVETGRDERAEDFIAASGADIRFGGDRAYYSPLDDYIRLPEFGAFDSAESFYGTALHELAHWTGHATRLARNFSGRFGDDAYAVEELVAEMSAAFLCADLGIEPEPREDHAAYIQSWLTVLKADKRAVFTAASTAQRAADYLSKLARVETANEPVAEPVENAA